MDSKKFVTKSMVALTLFTTTASTLPLTVSANSHKETTHKKVKHHKVKQGKAIHFALKQEGKKNRWVSLSDKDHKVYKKYGKDVYLPVKTKTKHHKVKKAVVHKKAKKHVSIAHALGRDAASIRHKEIKGFSKVAKTIGHKEGKAVHAVGKEAAHIRHNEYKVFNKLFHHHKR